MRKKFKFVVIKFEFFCENHPPTRHIKYKMIDFALCNKSFMVNKLLSTNFEQFLRQVNNLRVNSAKSNAH